MFFLLFPGGKDIMKTIDPKGIGARIKNLRKERGLTQQALADELGVTLNYISKIEPGMKVPSIDVLVVMAEYFGVSLDHIVLGKE